MLILASTSPTRKRLLKQAGIACVAVAPDLDERELEARENLADPEALARRLAAAKALAVSARYPHAVVIGADQVLSLDGEVLHKGAGRAGVAARLDALRGRTHQLDAAASLVREGRVLWTGTERARLAMRDFSPTERDRVLDLEGEAVLGSVGGYRLEGPSIQLFSSVVGDYFTILGLPLLLLLGALHTHAPQLLEGEA